MLLNNINKLTDKPEIYESGTATMWTDSYISEQLLSVHLDENIDLASRKKPTIDSTVEWILKNVKKDKLDILDLGCGPGLYSERLAQKGHRVMGIDFSECSIQYARNTAKSNNLEIEYLNMNYLDMQFENKFDLIILIYTDFGVLLPEDRQMLLSNIYMALKPGGTFIFDVLSDQDLDKKLTAKNWEITKGGFWNKGTYLALSDSFLFPKEKVILYQHIIIDEFDTGKAYRFWTHFFNENDLLKILSGFSFHRTTFHRNVLPDIDLWSGNNVVFCITTKN